MNLNRIKAIMFDIDGTLINRKLEMSEKTKYVLKTLKEKGYILTTNTGRPATTSKKILDRLGVFEYFDYLYSCNGNEVVDIKKNERSFIQPIDKDILTVLDQYFDDDYLSICYYSDDNTILYYNHKIDDESLFNDWNRMRMTTPEKGDFGGSDLFLPKAIILFKPEHFDELKKKIENLPDKRIKIFRSGLDCMEIMPSDVTKGSSVLHLSSKLGISSDEIMCFGDEESDVPALLNCFGVMVGGKDKIADLGIKSACEDVFNDGIYKFLVNNSLIKPIE